MYFPPVFRPGPTDGSKRAFKSSAEYFWRLSRRRLSAPGVLCARMHILEIAPRYFPKILIARLTAPGKKLLAPGESVRCVRSEVRAQTFSSFRLVSASLVYKHTYTRYTRFPLRRGNFPLQVNGAIDRRIQGTMDASVPLDDRWNSQSMSRTISRTAVRVNATIRDGRVLLRGSSI